MDSKNSIHRDLKFKNILLAKDLKVKILYMSLKKFLDALSSVTSRKFDTLIKMGPELLEWKYYGFTVDTWSLWCILYKLVAGEAACFANTREDSK